MENIKEILRNLELRDETRFVALPEEWTKSMDEMFLLQVASCRHFRREGIREGGYIGIDMTIPFEEGKPCAFFKLKKDKPIFKLSRKYLIGYKYVGQLALVINLPLQETTHAV